MISRVCEEFKVLPAEALEAIENDVGNLIFKIIGLRAYAKAKEAYDQGLKETDFSRRPKGPMIDQVREIMFELAAEEIARRKQEGD